MKITITAGMLCTLTNGHFTLEACEAICSYFDECGSECAPYIGDIICSFGELPAEDVEEYDEESVIATLDNGNVVVAF